MTCTVNDVNIARVWLCRHEGFTARQVQDLPLDELFDLYALSRAATDEGGREHGEEGE